MLTAWNKMTGIRAKRLADTEDIPRDEWLHIRRQGIGGSDIAAIAGLNPFKSAIDVYLEKKELATTEENEKMKWGKLLEEKIAEEFSREEKCKIFRVNAILQSQTIPFAFANVDRIIKNHPEHKKNGVLEVKQTGWAMAWEKESIPDMYVCQGQWYLGITGLQWGKFAVLIGGNQLHIPDEMEADKTMFDNMVKIADRFWNYNIKKNIPPDPDRAVSCRDAFKILYPECKEITRKLSPKLSEAITIRQDIINEMNRLKSDKNVIDARIMAEMMDAKYGETNTHHVTMVIKSGIYFNEKQFKCDYPKLYSKYSKPSIIKYPLVMMNKQKEIA